MENKTTTKFYLREKLNDQGRATIYMRIITNRKKNELATSYSLSPSEWDAARQRPKSNKQIFQELAKLENMAYRIQTQLEDENRPVSARIIKEYLTGKNKVNAHLIEYFEQFICGKIDNPELSSSTPALYRQTYNYIKTFLKAEYKASDILLREVDYKCITRFDQFLLKQNLKKNTVNKHHSRFRTLIHQGINEGQINHNPYKNFPIKKVNSEPRYLKHSELDKLSSHELNGNPRLLKVRDIFIFSVYTGIRYQDAQNLELKNIVKGEEGKLFIHFKQQKTGELITIPLLEPAKLILDKYDNNERKITGKVLPRLSNSKVNKYLKEIGRLVGIDESKNLTHHVARHTCATTILLARGVPLEVVSKWLGHTSIKQTLIYAKITEEYLGHIANNLDNQLLSNQNHLNTYSNFQTKNQLR